MKVKTVLVASVVVPLVAVAVTVAWAETNETYYACVNDSSGVINMVSEGETCKNHETLIHWNQIGPPGPQGDRGETGDTGPQGPEGPEGPEGAQGPQGIQGHQGEIGPQGPVGDDGAPGAPGERGPAGLSCWDLNGNGAPDPEEDLNGDSVTDILDCRGSQGETGAAGLDGQPGANGFSCWDINNNGLAEPAEDVNGDGQVSALDCRGPQGEPGGTGNLQGSMCTGGLFVIGFDNDGRTVCGPPVHPPYWWGPDTLTMDDPQWCRWSACTEDLTGYFIDAVDEIDWANTLGTISGGGHSDPPTLVVQTEALVKPCPVCDPEWVSDDTVCWLDASLHHGLPLGCDRRPDPHGQRIRISGVADTKGYLMSEFTIYLTFD